MPSLIDLRRRIRSVKNTEQITKAMKMVSAAKLRRAQERVIVARPYANLMREMLADIAAAAKSDERALESPWLAVREMKRVDLIFFSERHQASRRRVQSNLLESVAEIFPGSRGSGEFQLIPYVGRKGIVITIARRNGKILQEHVNLAARPTFQDAAAIAREVIRRYRDGETDAVFVVNNEFKSVMSQKLSVMQLLPVELEGDGTGKDREIKDYIYEQSPVDMLDRLMPRYVEVAVFRALLETIASYQAARMTAMDKASSNARDVIDSLTLNMNRIRQAAITKEIIEVVSGAAAAEE